MNASMFCAALSTIVYRSIIRIGIEFILTRSDAVNSTMKYSKLTRKLSKMSYGRVSRSPPLASPPCFFLTSEAI